MATPKQPINLLLLIFFTFLIAAFFIQGFATQEVLPHHQVGFHSSPSSRDLHLKGGGEEWSNWNSRRLMIGSTAPTCTYNECRGCKFKCRAEQIPVDGNDPVNSAYHYRCVCHR
ncbi:hypothetical protein HHK36_027177 [Tetracentron sinense]|uniref:Stomagen C-terminal domain-containing protein n=1 Tax=Tetracentron sinense TaxID=13715 RepID=A0A835D656_TETSI|nr:hypothetical protein HHK36_027177 [Tetracentron sinense]